MYVIIQKSKNTGLLLLQFQNNRQMEPWVCLTYRPELTLYSANAYGLAFSARSGEAILLESGAWLTSTLRYSTVRSSGEVFR